MTNLCQRIISSFVLGIIAFSFVIATSTYRRYMVIIILILTLHEWIKISNKNKYLCCWGILYIIPAFLFWILIPYTHVDAMLILLITCTCDTFAYFGGKIIGGPKLAPIISPQKTLSGAICGSIGATWISFGIIRCTLNLHNPIWHYHTIIMYIFISGLIAICGDLLESKIKRILNIKDSGNLIPGHGGILDRLDSFLAVSNAWGIWYCLKLI